MHGKYNTADWVLSTIAMIGWLGILGGGWIVFVGLRGHNVMGALTGGGGIVAISLIMIAMTQLARAQIDTAITNAQILALMQKQDDAISQARGLAEKRP